MRLSSFASRGAFATTFLAMGATSAFAQVNPPCPAPNPYVFECTGPSTAVDLDGTGLDPQGTASFEWFEECPTGFFVDPSDPTPTFIMDMTGACSRVCVFALRVTPPGGPTSVCNGTITVQDTQAPVISCPPDIVEIWTVGPAGGQTDPNLTGFATASDCDPNVVIGFSDVIVPGTQPGDPESVITRTWTATDQCGFSSNCQQVITLLSPGNNFQSFYLDAIKGSCPNIVDVNADSGLFTAVIFGRTGYNVADIDQTTLQLVRQDNLGTPVKRMSKLVKDVGRPKLGNPCDCDGLKDSQQDITVTMSLPAVITGLGLDAEATGATVNVALTFKTNDGKWHTTLDCVSIDRL